MTDIAAVETRFTDAMGIECTITLVHATPKTLTITREADTTQRLFINPKVAATIAENIESLEENDVEPLVCQFADANGALWHMTMPHTDILLFPMADPDSQIVLGDEAKASIRRILRNLIA